jgi:hypothetical protein
MKSFDLEILDKITRRGNVFLGIVMLEAVVIYLETQNND